MTGSAAGGSNGGAGVVEQPWSELELARLYDAFPFSGDLPLYLTLAERQGGRVLELACGTGRVLLPLVEAGHQVTGVDASPHMLAIAREKLARAGAEAAERARLAQADMRTFQLDQQFDLAIIAVKSFAYLLERQDQLAALTRIFAHLRPGGLLALDLKHPSLEWLGQPDGSLRQDLTQHLPEQRLTVVRTETAVSTDLARQIRLIRSIYDLVGDDGSVARRIVEWPYRFVYRFEVEHLLERAGFEVEAISGGYRGEPFESDSPTMLVEARRPAG